MNIAILGLGYVGCVSAACFAKWGHRVIGVDINPTKVALVRDGISPVKEPGLDALIREGIRRKLLEATSDAFYAVDRADVLMICVGTPSRPDGSLDTTFLERSCREIGSALRYSEGYKVVVVRSTILPGIAQQLLIPILESESQKQPGRDFGLSVNPEFLREGKAVWDFEYPPFTLIGELDDRSGETTASLYSHLQAPIYRVPLGVAEMVKYACNLFHALKVVFANEIGTVCKTFGIDGHQVMDIFVQDTKLNISSAYLRPGFAFGGSCLGKDTRALLYVAHQRGLRLPALEAILPSNQTHIQRVLDVVLSAGGHVVALLGLSFKKGSDDLRESPALEIGKQLLDRGFDLHIFDPDISPEHLLGSNKRYLEEILPGFERLLAPSLGAALENAEIVIITKPLYQEEQNHLVSLLQNRPILVIDLVRLDGLLVHRTRGTYYGIAW